MSAPRIELVDRFFSGTGPTYDFVVKLCTLGCDIWWKKKIFEKIPNTLVNGDRGNRLPNTLSVSFEYVEGESILLLLSDLGICASSGSACTSGSLEPSHVLRAMGVPFTAAHGSIRFSLSIYNSKEEMDYIINHLPPIIQRLRDISPFWKDYLKSQGKR